MKNEIVLLSSNCDGNPISVSINIPEGNIKGIFQMAHGMVDHKERYSDFLEYICKLGYVTVVSDHRGHGKSVKSNDDFGYFYDNTGKYIVEDLHQVTMYIKERYPDKKVILMGHSMGSLVIRNYIQEYDNDIDKLIVCGSPSSNDSINFGISLCKFMIKFKGDRYRSKFFRNITLGVFNKTYKNEGNNAWLTKNKDLLDVYKNDPLCNFNFTLNGYLNLFILLKNTYDKKLYKVNNKNLSILFISGSDDKALGTVKKWYEAQVILKEVGYSKVSSKLYEGLRHEIINEINNQNIYLDIVEFIEN